MASNLNINTPNSIQGMTDTIHFTNLDGLKDTLDEIDLANIRTQFKMAKDPIYLAFEHIERQPLKKIAKDFVRDLSDGFVEFIISLPTIFQGE